MAYAAQERERQRELELIKQQYLGAEKQKKKVGRLQGCLAQARLAEVVQGCQALARLRGVCLAAFAHYSQGAHFPIRRRSLPHGCSL